MKLIDFMRVVSAHYIIIVCISIKLDCHAHEIRVVNRCEQNIWIGTFGDNNQIPEGGNFFLARNKPKTFNVPHKWLGGKIWGKTGCDAKGSNCVTGNAPIGGRTTLQAVTLAEFGLDKDDGNDYYDISLVDGFNLPISISPYKTKSGNRCKKVACNFKLDICPADKNFKVYGPGGKKVVACNSACSATRDKKYCCPEPEFNRDTFSPSKYSKLFKKQCQNAYSYAYDDKTGVFACSSSSLDSSSYEVIFCP